MASFLEISAMLVFPDFNDNVTQVSLSGSIVKSKRNCVPLVPVVLSQEVLGRYQADNTANGIHT